MVTVKAGGQDTLDVPVFDQVSGQLVGYKFFVGIVLVEGMDHPVAPGPHGPEAVILVPVRIGIACHIHPVEGHALAIVTAFQQFIYHLLVSVRALVFQEAILQFQ
ncbi:hypothetical protein FQZ97_857330 [compost metagenome]